MSRKYNNFFYYTNMKIGFDAKQAMLNNETLGDYSRSVIEIMSDYFSGNHYVCFATKKKKKAGRLKTILSRKDISFAVPTGIFKLFAALWWLFGLKRAIKKQKISVFHGLTNKLPGGIEKTRVKTVVTIHDLIFLRNPEYYKPVERKLYPMKFKSACERANKVIAVSERIKRDIIVFFEIPVNKVEVVYPVCHSNFKETVAAKKKKKIEEKYKLPEKFLLCVGRIEARKNLMVIVKSLNKIPEEFHLVAVGKPTAYQAEVKKYAKQNGLSSRVHILNNVAFADLPAIYQSATLFVYPSFFEGFALPIVDALSCGLPVIAALGSSLEEAGGPDSIYFDPNDDEELAEEINAVLDDEAVAAGMITSGKKYARRFSEKAIAEQLMEIYRAL
ncbi:mannosyltransferase [Candidatus Symbiothrix dinenymphae]|nr:mannosyltransferase [Candidatus Symbiothrix dinenymphae]